MKRLFIAILSLFLTLPAFAEEEYSPVVTVLDAQSLFGYSAVAGDDEGDFSTYHDYLASVAFNLSESDQLIGMYNGSFTKDQLFIAQDEGSRQSNKMMTNNFTAAYNKVFSETFSFKPAFFYNVIWIKETADEQLGDGLYDYEDIGGGFENTHVLEWDSGDKSVLTYEFNIFSRQYPNFVSLLSAFDPNATSEVEEKDLTGYKFNMGYQGMVSEEITGVLSGMVLYKDYTDKLTIDENGIREDGSMREDIYYEISGTLMKELNEEYSLLFSSTYRQNFSNLDLYDTRNTASLGDDRFFEGYYNYLGYSVGPLISWQAAEGPAYAAQVGYSLDSTYYPGRSALEVDGDLLNEDQQDFSHSVYGQFSAPISDNVNWLLKGSWKKSQSNQDFEDFYLYNYETWSVMSGISFEN